MLLALDDVGPGPVLVLLHGFPMDRSIWRNQTAEIGLTYRIIAPDLRGQGASPAPDGTYAVDLLADDVIDLLDALELEEKVVVGGLSMGGYVAMSLVLRYPDRFRGLILMNTRAAADPPSTANVREELAQILEQTGKTDVIVDQMLFKLFAPSTYSSHHELVDRVKWHALHANPIGLANTLRGLAIRPDRTHELTKITMPTLVLAGEHDQLIPLDDSKVLASGIPNAQLVTIPGAGHLAPLENGEATNAAILDFLKKLGD
jgi:pimeloyl-ACP methyl ester carboxylesterase